MRTTLNRKTRFTIQRWLVSTLASVNSAGLVFTSNIVHKFDLGAILPFTLRCAATTRYQVPRSIETLKFPGNIGNGASKRIQGAHLRARLSRALVVIIARVAGMVVVVVARMSRWMRRVFRRAGRSRALAFVGFRVVGPSVRATRGTTLFVLVPVLCVLTASIFGRRRGCFRTTLIQAAAALLFPPELIAAAAFACRHDDGESGQEDGEECCELHDGFESRVDSCGLDQTDVGQMNERGSKTVVC